MRYSSGPHGWFAEPIDLVPKPSVVDVIPGEGRLQSLLTIRITAASGTCYK